MQELIREKDVSDETQLVVRLRSAITDWATTIPHHGIRSLGDAIDITGVTLMPGHVVTMQNQYETRTVGLADREVYRGGAIPERQIFGPDEVDAWDRLLDGPDGFEDREEAYSVRGSQHVEDCGRCDGRGTSVCTTCGGKGEATCGTCGGSCKTTCSTCNGRGHQQTTCSACGGSGQKKLGLDANTGHMRYTDCGSCGGSRSRSTTCSRCRGSKRISCHACGATGTVRCSSCGGDGRVTCTLCDGHRKMLYELQITQAFEYTVKQFVDEHAEVLRCFSGLEIESDSDSGTRIIELEGDSIDSGVFDHHEAIRDGVVDCQEGFDLYVDSTCHIVKQGLTVDRVDVYWVSYAYAGGTYKLIVHGDDFTVHAPWNPISHVRKDLIKQARERVEAKDFTAAMRLLDQATAMKLKGYEKKLPALREQVRQKLEKPIGRGALVGALSSSVVLWLLSPLLFAEPDLIVVGFAREAFIEHAWFTEMHPLVMAVLMVGINLVVVPPLSSGLAFALTKYRLGSGFLRFLAGIVMSLLLILVPVTLGLVLHTLGLGLLATALVYWAMAAFAAGTARFAG